MTKVEQFKATMKEWMAKLSDSDYYLDVKENEAWRAYYFKNSSIYAYVNWGYRREDDTLIVSAGISIYSPEDKEKDILSIRRAENFDIDSFMQLFLEVLPVARNRMRLLSQAMQLEDDMKKTIRREFPWSR